MIKPTYTDPLIMFCHRILEAQSKIKKLKRLNKLKNNDKKQRTINK